MIQRECTVPLIEGMDLLPLGYAARRLADKGSVVKIDRVNWPRFAYTPVCSALVARSERALYIGFEVECEELRAVNVCDNTAVYHDSCVEFFMKPPQSASYFNFEFNCIGTCLASECFSHSNTAFLSSDELEQVKRFPSLGKRGFELLDGLHRWSLMVVIPFVLLRLDPQHLPSHITANFHKCADKTTHRHYLTWNPVDTPAPDFHRPEYFGILKF